MPTTTPALAKPQRLAVVLVLLLSMLACAIPEIKFTPKDQGQVIQPTAPPTAQSTFTPYPTYTPFPTQPPVTPTTYPTYTPYPTPTVPAPTYTPYPTYTPLPTQPPARPTATSVPSTQAFPILKTVSSTYFSCWDNPRKVTIQVKVANPKDVYYILFSYRIKDATSDRITNYQEKNMTYNGTDIWEITIDGANDVLNPYHFGDSFFNYQMTLVYRSNPGKFINSPYYYDIRFAACRQ